MYLVKVFSPFSEYSEESITKMYLVKVFFPISEYSEESINRSVADMGGLYPADCEGGETRSDKEKQVRLVDLH